MTRRLLGGLVATVVVVVLLASILAVALVEFSGKPVAAAPVATLTVFVGSAQVQKLGAKTATAGRSGQTLGNGDTVSTSADGKAAIDFPDGSVTRLDSAATATVRLARAARSGFLMGVNQTAGLTWNTVKKLAGAADFRVTGPNGASAAVRGTRFGFYIEHDAAGATVVWIDVYDGVVAVAGAVGPAVTATANQRVNVRANTPPTAPVPIPNSDFHLSFTVFNQTLEATAGKPVAFGSGALSSGQSAGPFTVASDGKSDLQFVLGWPGSIFELTVIDPNGKIYAQPAATGSPIKVSVPRALAGSWNFKVRDVTSAPQEPWWVVVGASPPKAA